MIQSLKKKICSHPFITEISKKTKLTPEQIVGIFVIMIAVLLDTTPVGSALNNFVCLALPMQETLILLKSPNSHVWDLKEILIFYRVFG